MRYLTILIFTLAMSACSSTSHEPIEISGLLVAAIDAKGQVKAKAEGCASFAENGRTCARDLTTSSLVRVASISKVGVSLAVMRLVEQRLLDLDLDISAYLKFSVANPNFPDQRITLRQLLSHTSSIIDGGSYALPLGTLINDELVKPDFWDKTHAPGTYFTYANFNFAVIATVMEAATKERFDHLMKRLVLDPLEIKGCYNWASCGEDEINRSTALYRTGADETDWHPGGPWVAQVDDLKGQRPKCPVRRANSAAECNLATYRPGTNGALFSPQGGLRISILDLAKFAEIILEKGKWNGRNFLSTQSIEEMTATAWQFAPTRPNGETEKPSMCAYGLSLQLTGLVERQDCRDDVVGDNRKRIGHLGEAYGLYGGIWIDKQSKQALIYLVTGTSDDPRKEPGQHSAFTRVEEIAAKKAANLIAP